MAETATRAGFTREAVEEISGLKNEPEWMRMRRLEAVDTYEKMPLPARNEEEWRRTDVSKLKLDGYGTFAPGGHGADALPADLRPTDDRAARAGLLVQHNSVGAARELDDDVRAKGVIVTDLDTAVREHADLVQRYFMTEAIPVTYNKFTALHAAFWSGGSFIYVPRNVEVELPVQGVLYADAPGLGIFGHTLIVVEENARLTYVEEYSSPRTGQPGFSSGVSELFLARGAHLRYVAMQEFSPEITSFSGMIRVYPGAQKTDAYQQNRNLLLSDDARADSIPNLEIGANDVRCSHGATVAPLDEDEIFYLQSRGIGRPEATKIIVDGFF